LAELPQFVDDVRVDTIVNELLLAERAEDR
jgi:hypothetical protein